MGQVDARSQFILTSVALDVDNDPACVFAEECPPRQRVGDQQNFLYPGMERRGNVVRKHAGGLDIERCRHVPGAGERIYRGLNRGHLGTRHHDLLPGGDLSDHLVALRVLT